MKYRTVTKKICDTGIHFPRLNIKPIAKEMNMIRMTSSYDPQTQSKRTLIRIPNVVKPSDLTISKE